MADAVDSAGTPWAGRSFPDVAPSDDDGAAPPALLEALARFRAGGCDVVAVVDELRRSRLLIPLIAELAEEGVGVAGHRSDKRAELAVVTVAGPDGRAVLPVFSSVDTMRAWNPLARPVPSDGVRVALAAASDRTELVVLDPASESEFCVRRPALWAIAQSLPFTPSYLDPDVHAAFAVSAEAEVGVGALRIANGDPTATLVGPELVVRLALRAGLEGTEVDALIGRLAAAWQGSGVIRDRVDSLRIDVVPA